MRKRALGVVAFACAHVLMSVSLTVVTFGAVMKGIDGGATASPTLVAFLVAASRLLGWPLAQIATPTASSLAQYAVLFANGLLWGCALLCAYVVYRRILPLRSTGTAGAI